MPASAPDLSAERRRIRARKAALARYRPSDDPTVVAADQDLRSLRVDFYIEKILAEAPPLTDEQRFRLAELLRPVRRATAK